MKNFINYAHRGASEYYPENTALSFRKGLEMGANGIETDVQKTKDGVVVLFHDDTLNRVTGKSGSIADYTYSELLEFDVVKGELKEKIISSGSAFKILIPYPKSTIGDKIVFFRVCITDNAVCRAKRYLMLAGSSAKNAAKI